MSINRIIVFTAATIFSLNLSYGQTLSAKDINSQDTNSYYEWISSIPDPGIRQKKSVLKFIEEIIFGKKKFSVSRPVDVILRSENKGWILNQENGEILYFNGSSLSQVKIKNGLLYQSIVSGIYIEDLGLIISDSATDMLYLIDSKGEQKKFCDTKLLSRPTGLVFDKESKTIWVVETGSHRISVLDKNGKILQRIGQRGSSPGQFNFPTHICSDNKGSIYIVDAMNFRVQIFDNKGNYISQFGEQGDASGKFARPKGIAIDSSGNIFVADGLFNTIQIFDREGNFLYYFGRKGSANGEFLMPSGVDIDENDYIYISDSYNDRIQVFKPTRNSPYE